MIASIWMTVRTLRQLLAGIVPLSEEQDVRIRGVQLDSRQVQRGDVFLALQGTREDGLQYARQAIEQGACAVLHESPCDDEVLRAVAKQEGVALIMVAGLRSKTSEIAARFYGYPSRQMGVIGVTGTDGKTSVSHFIAQALAALGRQSAVIGTVGNGLVGKQTQTLVPSSHTTPDAVSLQALFDDYRENGVNHVSMEVSSHALDQHRTDAVEFNLAVLTNLGRDHMDYHKSMDAYAEAKRQLFYSPALQGAVLNCDDDFGCLLALELEENLPVYGYGFSVDMYPNMAARVMGKNLSLLPDGLRFDVSCGGQSFSVHSSLMGRFNAHNLLAVIATLVALGVPLSEAVELVHQLIPVPGRMQLLTAPGKPAMVVDYAHTPQALASALASLQEHVDGKLYCVFGCGGERDKGKRALMGRIAEEYADGLVLTNDNPRSESPRAIIDNILEGMAKPDEVTVEFDRARAIAMAFEHAQEGDVVLIAGKGHEDYQLVGRESIGFSDLVVAEGLLKGEYDD